MSEGESLRRDHFVHVVANEGYILLFGLKPKAHAEIKEVVLFQFVRTVYKIRSSHGSFSSILGSSLHQLE